MSSSLTASAPIATRAARKNAAGTVLRASLFAMLALVSLRPCFSGRPARDPSAAAAQVPGDRGERVWNVRVRGPIRGHLAISLRAQTVAHPGVRLPLLPLRRPNCTLLSGAWGPMVHSMGFPVTYMRSSRRSFTGTHLLSVNQRRCPNSPSKVS
jgi:hypothetical protein